MLLRLVFHFGKDDLIIPESKTKLIDDTKKLIADYETQYSRGVNY